MLIFGKVVEYVKGKSYTGKIIQIIPYNGEIKIKDGESNIFPVLCLALTNYGEILAIHKDSAILIAGNDATMPESHVNLKPSLELILEAIQVVISTESGVLISYGAKEYALNRKMVYEQLELRGLPRKDSLEVLLINGVLKKDSKGSYTRSIMHSNRVVKAICVSLSRGSQ